MGTAFAYVGSSIHEKAAEHVGFLAMVMNCGMFVAPLRSLGQVLLEKSSESLPFLQVLMALLCSRCWATVGVRRRAIPMLLPNLLGFVLSCVQLAFIMYL